MLTPEAMLPLRNMLMQELTNAVRPAAVLEAAAKFVFHKLVGEYLPSEINTFRLGWSCFSCTSAPKFPCNGAAAGGHRAIGEQPSDSRHRYPPARS